MHPHLLTELLSYIDLCSLLKIIGTSVEVTYSVKTVLTDDTFLGSDSKIVKKRSSCELDITDYESHVDKYMKLKFTEYNGYIPIYLRDSHEILLGPSIKSLVLTNCMVADLMPHLLDGLANVDNLVLTRCMGINGKYMKNLRKVVFNRCDVVDRDVRCLGKLHTVKLDYCNKITDVSCLRNICNLEIRDCRRVRQFSCMNVTNLRVVGGCFAFFRESVDVGKLCLSARCIVLTPDVDCECHSGMSGADVLRAHFSGFDDFRKNERIELSCESAQGS